jgi:HPt (histidine-containing phosphotransfer) domain-containing protein
MNDVITKPIRQRSFLNQVGKWIETTAPDAKSPGFDTHDAPLDYQAALLEHGGDQAMLDMSIRSYSRQVDHWLTTLREAIEQVEPTQARNHLRKIRGGAENITAHSLAEMANQLDNRIGKGLIHQLDAEIDAFQAECNRIKHFSTSRQGPRDGR